MSSAEYTAHVLFLRRGLRARPSEGFAGAGRVEPAGAGLDRLFAPGQVVAEVDYALGVMGHQGACCPEALRAGVAAAKRPSHRGKAGRLRLGSLYRTRARCRCPLRPDALTTSACEEVQHPP